MAEIKSSLKSCCKRALNPYNLLALVITPLVLWGCDFFVHIYLGQSLNSRIWFALISISMPLLGYFLIVFFYHSLSNKLSGILAPEFSGMVGFLYGQPLYMILSKLALQGTDSISFSESIKTLIILTPIVPVSTIMISTYDATLLAVPLTCLTMLLAGWRYRRKIKTQSV
ncbi:hypothetical protein BMS3Abin07_00988 [bacterium BMS3Abin07]|nr:hypothetical protein BMS3Abin07_00988 [bacterium BMS3Abin07]HDL20319.1 hypothetical protein [Nitrospirota bacterium]HDO22691.1 hypothetical protein [Nitrospirota bacterium]HDZ89024.1 hypothetical protein [Nitrospirota bacterium]